LSLEQKEKKSDKFSFFVKNQSIVVPIVALIVAFLLGAILIAFQGVNPITAYRLLH
jgi:simple sugar transport system permease protein